MADRKFVHVTVLAPAGRLPAEVLNKVLRIVEENDLELFFTNAQNLRLLYVPIEKEDEIKAKLLALGVSLKKKGIFPGARVCVGAPHCNTGIAKTDELSAKIADRFADREQTKPKFKIAIAGCSIGCSDPRTTDIGIITTNKGYDLYLGGKGGTKPQVGVKMLKGLSEDELLDALETMVEYHDKNTDKKSRIASLMSNEDFPFSEV